MDTALNELNFTFIYKTAQVRNLRPFYKTESWFHRFFLQVLLSGAVCFFSFKGYSQNCPPNIDFEKGNFDGWTCYIGSVAEVGGQNVISLTQTGPVFNRHTIYAANSGEVDPYGGFSVNCPNGSGYSIRLGNSLAGTEAEGISYEFTIPANRN